MTGSLNTRHGTVCFFIVSMNYFLQRFEEKSSVTDLATLTFDAIDKNVNERMTWSSKRVPPV